MLLDFIYLASASPRRRELLQQIGVHYRLVETVVHEGVLPGEEPRAYVARLAAAKASAGWERSRSGPEAAVLGADTAVALGGKIMGKPADRDDAQGMLRQLSGRTHEVLTAVALRSIQGLKFRISRSEVTFRRISAGEARAYWDTGEAADKAGGYAIQGRAAVFVADLRGSYSGVMGLPLFETAELLDEAGALRWQSSAAP